MQKFHFTLDMDLAFADGYITSAYAYFHRPYNTHSHLSVLDVTWTPTVLPVSVSVSAGLFEAYNETRVVHRTPATSKKESFEIINYCCKALHFRYLQGPGYASGGAEVLIALHNDFTWNSRKVFFIFFYFLEKVLFTIFLVSII